MLNELAINLNKTSLNYVHIFWHWHWEQFSFLYFFMSTEDDENYGRIWCPEGNIRVPNESDDIRDRDIYKNKMCSDRSMDV